MSAPELACVVLALRNPPELTAAVRSLTGQNVALEIVVVNSGGGNVKASLEASGLDVPAIERSERLLPGAARNAGVAATRAPFVAFLAADCLALPGWAEARLATHRAGAVAVASAVTNPHSRALAAWTSYVALFNRRMPGVPARGGAPVRRVLRPELFDLFGLFREDLRGGEDTEFHGRFAHELGIAWEPRVRTAHRHPTRIGQTPHRSVPAGSEKRRGVERIGGPTPVEVAWDALRRTPKGARIAWLAAGPEERRWIAAASLLLPFSAFAYAAGSLLHGTVRDREAEA